MTANSRDNGKGGENELHVDDDDDDQVDVDVMMLKRCVDDVEKLL